MYRASKDTKLRETDAKSAQVGTIKGGEIVRTLFETATIFNGKETVVCDEEC